MDKMFLKNFVVEPADDITGALNTLKIADEDTVWYLGSASDDAKAFWNDWFQKTLSERRKRQQKEFAEHAATKARLEEVRSQINSAMQSGSSTDVNLLKVWGLVEFY
jgi:hypothetical protein